MRAAGLNIPGEASARRRREVGREASPIRSCYCFGIAGIAGGAIGAIGAGDVISFGSDGTTIS